MNTELFTRYEQVTSISIPFQSIQAIVTQAPQLRLENSDNNNSKTEYIWIDNDIDDAFAHWVYESAIYLPQLKQLLQSERYTLLLSKRRQYKQLFLDFFNIPSERVSYEGKSWITPLPIVWVPKKPLCLSFKNIDQSFIAVFSRLLIDFRNSFEKVLIETKATSIPIVFLPRQCRENYAPNDRRLNYHDIAEWVISNHGVILQTDKTQRLIHDQLLQIHRASAVILDYGSSFYVNALLATHSSQRIVVLGNMNHHIDYPVMKLLYEEILKYCSNIFLINKPQDYCIADFIHHFT